MPIIDMRAVGNDGAAQLQDCDVCIVGSGPAGSTIARELSGTALRVTLLESGGTLRDSNADALNDVENVGYPRLADQWAVRNRILGGTSHTWGGRCAPFDAIDLEARSWVPDSGWPFSIADLASYLDRSAPHLGLAVGSGFSDERFWALAGGRSPRSVPDPNVLLPFYWQFSRDRDETYPFEHMRVGRKLAERVGPNVTLVTGATVLRIDPVDSGRAVRSVAVAAPEGRVVSLAVGTVVVCAGGIENARILLASDTVVAGGLGNRHDTVGRYFMDHLRGPVGTFALAGSGALQKRFGRHNLRSHLFRAGLRLSPEIQREEQLLNCAAWLGEVVAPDDPWNALKRILGGRPELPADARAVAANAGLFLRGFKDYFVERSGVPRKLESLTLDCMGDQRPDRDSRVTLSDRHDRFGMRLPRVDWRVHPEEARTVRRMAQLVAEQLPRMGLPAPALSPWVREGGEFPEAFRDVAHPSGTTRMATDPAKGVVDGRCEVHGVSGLYLAGSSVFPTLSHCNPTQMIVALAIRLADRIKATAAVPARAGQWSEAAARKGEAATRVLVTGATGRIGQVVVEDLLSRSYAVRAITSRVELPPVAPGAALEWRRFDLQTDTDYDGLVASCQAVLHIAAEMAEPARMHRANVEATGWLADAAERAGIGAFCYTSSTAVYGSGRTRVMHEGAPVLTHDRDIRNEYWAVDQTRAYGRTKLGGEVALRARAKAVRYVILRPAVVVSVAQIVEIRDWSRVKRTLAAHRHAHHVYVGDVADAIIWSMERALAGTGALGSVETFNLSEEDVSDPTHAAFLRKAYAVSGDPRFKVPPMPWPADWLRDFLRFRTLPLRNPGWRMRFPGDALATAGYRHRYGMARAYALALDAIREDARRGRPVTGAATRRV